MRKRSLAVAPALRTAALAISHSSVKPARKNTEVEALPKPGKMHDELLKEVILEARAFSRPELRERQDSQQHPALPTAKPQADTEPMKTKSEEELLLHFGAAVSPMIFKQFTKGLFAPVFNLVPSEPLHPFTVTLAQT